MESYMDIYESLEAAEQAHIDDVAVLDKLAAFGKAIIALAGLQPYGESPADIIGYFIANSHAELERIGHVTVRAAATDFVGGLDVEDIVTGTVCKEDLEGGYSDGIECAYTLAREAWNQ